MDITEKNKRLATHLKWVRERFLDGSVGLLVDEIPFDKGKIVTLCHCALLEAIEYIESQIEPAPKETDSILTTTGTGMYHMDFYELTDDEAKREYAWHNGEWVVRATCSNCGEHTNINLLEQKDDGSIKHIKEC